MSDSELKLSYKEAIAELEKIVNALQNDNCDIDNMVALTRRATVLLKLCRERLTTTEQQLQQALADLQAK